MKEYRIYQVDSFTTEKFKGNPAGVVPNADGITEPQMQAIARELNNSETAFIFSPKSKDHDVWIRFFTPTVEVPSCGHATIAANYVRAVENNLSSCTIQQKTGIGILPVRIEKIHDDYKVTIIQGEISFSEPFEGEIRRRIVTALGLTNSDIENNCPIQVVSTGHAKVMVGINEKSKLNSLKPNLSQLAVLSKSINCNGYFVFTLDSDHADVLTHGRMFAPAIGIPEDPVTGNANGPLGAYLVKNRLVDVQGDTFSFEGHQGEAISRPGIVEVSVECDNCYPKRVEVSGRAVIVFESKIVI